MAVTEVELREFYNDYAPPSHVYNTVRALLRSVPEKYVQGIDCVVLTNQSGHPRRHRLGKISSRKHRISQSKVRGRYHPAYEAKRPWIELFVDNIAAGTAPKGFWSFVLARVWRDGSFGDVLFHEIGRHIHATVRPEHREKEDVADDWGKKLLGNFARKKYWYVVPIAKPLSKLIKSFTA